MWERIEYLAEVNMAIENVLQRLLEAELFWQFFPTFKEIEFKLVVLTYCCTAMCLE